MCARARKSRPGFLARPATDRARNPGLLVESISSAFPCSGRHTMKSVLAAGFCFSMLVQGASGAPVPSYLYQPSYCMDKSLRGPAEPYCPRPGDIMLATDGNLFWKITHDLALAFEPHNSAIFFSRRDGSLALLEAGPNDTI